MFILNFYSRAFLPKATFLTFLIICSLMAFPGPGFLVNAQTTDDQLTTFTKSNIFPTVGKRPTPEQIQKAKDDFASGKRKFKTVKFNLSRKEQYEMNKRFYLNLNKGKGAKHLFFYKKGQYMFMDSLESKKTMEKYPDLKETDGEIDTSASGPQIRSIMAAPASSPLPSRWRIPGRFIQDNARNQGGCGSCGTFAAVGIMESKYARKHTQNVNDVDISEQMILNCASSDCSGGWPSTALSYADWADSWGSSPLPRERSCPYVARKESCNSNKPRKFSASAWGSVGTGKDDLKRALREFGALAIIINTNAAFNGNYGSDAVVSLPTTGFSGNHAIMLLGWDNDKGWLVRNSWGDEWGINGIGWISYSSKIFYADWVRMD